MKVNRTHTYRLEPTEYQKEALDKLMGTVRFVWNRGVQLTRSYLDNNCYVPKYNELNDHLSTWKSTFPFLKEDGHSQGLQQKLKDLERTWKLYFSKEHSNTGKPKFKKKYQSDSIRFPQGFQVKGDYIKLPKLGWINFRKSREFPESSQLKSVVVSRDKFHYFVNIQIEYDINPGHHKSNSTIGLDLGVTKFLTCSDGTVFQPLTGRYDLLNRKLKRLQKSLSRKKKFSKNFHKQVRKISKLYKKISNIRHDFLHQVSTIIAKSHGYVVVENLNVRNMTSSAKGTVDNPGTNVKAKSGLNRSILEQGWSKFLSMLQYKLEELGGLLVKVDPKYTSQTCPSCGVIDSSNRTTQSDFTCVHCGYHNNADVVGATNIKYSYVYS